MKKLLLVLFLIFPFFVFAQKVRIQSSGKVADLKEIIGNYCIVSTGKPFDNKVLIQSDDSDLDFVDENGEKMKFKTIVAILNYMDINGWEFIQCYGDPLKSYIFRRKNNK